jgi:hypothetical protein
MPSVFTARARAFSSFAVGVALATLATLATGCVTTSTPANQPPCACNAPPQEQQITGGGHVTPGN